MRHYKQLYTSILAAMACRLSHAEGDGLFERHVLAGAGGGLQGGLVQVEMNEAEILLKTFGVK